MRPGRTSRTTFPPRAASATDALMYHLETVGNAENRTASRITPGLENVPEPAGMLLIAAGCLAAAAMRRR